MNPPRFRTLLLEALKHFQENGFTSASDLTDWLLTLRYALEKELPTDEASRKEIAAVLQRVYGRDLRSGIVQRVPGVSRYTIDRIAPQLRAELDRRIFASADLIRLNKKAAVEKTLQRFSGWTTSQPPGGSKTPVRQVAAEILKPSRQLKFERRRVAIDQGHKLSASISHVVAIGSGAIGCIWHDRGEHDRGYDARPEHLARSGKLFLLSDSWAIDQGLVKRGSAPYYDDLEDQAAVLPYCSCYVTWLTAPRDLPAELLTAKGRAFVEGRPMLEAV